MANEIYREIFVTREEYTPPIQYVQAANAIPIVARICDYNIPSGAKANVYIKKPSGKSVQDTAVIDGNTVTIDVKTQMFAEIGMSIMQIQITNGQDVLLTFDLPVMVRKNRTEPGAPESENEAAFFTELQEAANKARIAAQEANNAAQAAEDALSVLEGAVEGTIINDDTPSDVTTFSGRHIENTFLEKNGDGGNVIVTFQQAADRAGIESGDSLAVAFGKLAKFFTDIQSYVFSPPVNNLLSTDTSRPLSAAMGKQLQEAVESINSALSVKVYPGEGQINGFESWAVVDNHTVTFCIRGTISNNLGTSDQYALVASFPQLKNLVTLNRLRLKRIEITPTIKGQIRFEQDTGILNIGYTYNNSGESIDIPKGVVLYLEETFVL